MGHVGRGIGSNKPTWKLPHAALGAHPVCLGGLLEQRLVLAGQAVALGYVVEAIALVQLVDEGVGDLDVAELDRRVEVDVVLPPVVQVVA